MSYLIEALIKKLEGEIAMARANIQVYTKNAAGIGEHPDIIEECIKITDELASAQDGLKIIKGYAESE